MYTTEGFEAEVQLRLGEQRSTRQAVGRRIRRAFLPGAFDVELDRQGRILVPQPLRQQCGLDERAVIVGCGDYIELWDPERWNAELARVGAEMNGEPGPAEAAAGGDA
jgi:MraZ protein